MYTICMSEQGKKEAVASTPDEKAKDAYRRKRKHWIENKVREGFFYGRGKSFTSVDCCCEM
jgi:hypothetical protein